MTETAMRTHDSETRLSDIALLAFDALPLLRQMLNSDRIRHEHAMPLSHVQVLVALGETGAMTVTDISARFGVARPNITPVVDRLMEQGLVERVRDDMDRRVVNIVLLPAGYEKLTTIHGTIVDAMAEWATRLSGTQLDDLNQALKTIARIVA